MSAFPQPGRTQAALRRGWCPSTLKPMETGDGWLVRLHPPGGRLAPAQLMRVAALAQEHGNSLIEISARGNMQLRGVSAQTHPALVAALLDERLVDEHDGGGPQRLTLVSPLAGADASDLVDAAALAEAIEARGRSVPGLPAKALVVVDGGGAVSLEGFSADLRLLGLGAGQVAIGLPHGGWRGPVSVAAAPEAIEALLRSFSRQRADAPGVIRRLRDLPPEHLASLCDLPAIDGPAARPAPARAGLLVQGGGRFAAIAALPFGRCTAIALDALARAARACGAGRLRLSPWRGIARLDLPESAARAWLAEAQRLGLIVDNGDPRLSVQACSGRPACLSAQSDAMPDAAVLAKAAAPLLAAGITLHVSGCVKSCAHPGVSDLTLSGREGRYDVVLHGATRDKAVATLDLSEILRRLQPGQDLHARLATAGRKSEPTA